MSVNRPGDRRKVTGRRGEELAAAYLAGQGYSVTRRNWRTRAGELDIIAGDGEWLVFVEVRARVCRSAAAEPLYGLPEDSVTRHKQRKLIAMAEAYIFETGWSGSWRIDVVAIDLLPDGSLSSLRHWRDVVQG